MKTQLIIINILLMALAMVEFTSCKKEENNTLTAAEYLTQGTWVFSNMTIEPGIDMGDGYPVTEVYPYLEDCQKDDNMNFNSNGTVFMDAGSTKCDPNEPQTHDLGNWTLSNNNSSLTISDPGGDSFSATIQTLNETRFIWAYQIEDTDDQGNPVTYNYTMFMVSQ